MRSSLVGILMFLVDYVASHTNNWAILVDTSKFWFNYRHVANTLSIYRSIKRLGIPDSHIILMLADDAACNPRNPRPATVYHNSNQKINIYGDDVEVDYRGYEVTAENFIRILTGRVKHGTPQSKQMLLDENSNVLVYMTGHGGQGFLKFQDTHEISDQELADTFQQMYQKRRYKSLLFIIETCKAASMLRYLYSPNVIGFAAARFDEDSYSHHSDSTIGVHVIDRFSHHMMEFLEKMDSYSGKTLSDLFECCNYHQCHSHTVPRTDLFVGDTRKTLVTEFFGSVRSAELIKTPTDLNLTEIVLQLNASKRESNQNSDESCGKPNNVVVSEDVVQKERRESPNLLERPKSDDGIGFALFVLGGLMLYIVVSAYEKQSRHKTASFEFVPAGLLPATCFNPN